jgi:hypothetical protein
MYGLGAGTLCTIGTISFVVVENFDIKGEGTKFQLRANQKGQPVIATRFSEVGDLVSVSGEVASIERPTVMRGQTATFAAFDDSDTGLGKDFASGTVEDCTFTGNRGAWNCNATIRLDPVTA